jgi:hypothetical protein
MKAAAKIGVLVQRVRIRQHDECITGCRGSRPALHQLVRLASHFLRKERMAPIKSNIPRDLFQTPPPSPRLEEWRACRKVHGEPGGIFAPLLRLLPGSTCKTSFSISGPEPEWQRAARRPVPDWEPRRLKGPWGPRGRGPTWARGEQASSGPSGMPTGSHKIPPHPPGRVRGVHTGVHESSQGQ